MKIEKEFLSSALFDKASSQYVAVDLKSRVGIWLSFEVFLILFTTLTILVARIATLQAPRGVRQMNGVPQSGADRSATAESRVRAYWSNLFTLAETLKYFWIF